MDDVLDIQDVAKLLKIDYQTAYKLVISGEIPAAKIGKLYRIKKSDLQEYFERMKDEVAQESKKPQKENFCSFCGKSIVSLASAGGRCAICGNYLCNDCYILEKKTLCKEHSEPAIEASSKKCGFCSKNISKISTGQQKCAAEGCNETICRECVEKNVLYCLEHTPTDESLKQKVEDLKAKGQPAVTAIEAKILENNFIERVKNRTASIETFFNPNSQSYAEIKTLAFTTALADQLAKFTKKSKEANEIGMKIPVGTRFSLEVALKKGFRRKENLCAIYAVSAARPDICMKNGYDSRPVTYKELVEISRPFIEKAEKEKILHVIGIASPTGWDEQARDYISGEDTKKSFSNPLVSIILINSSTGAIYQSATDAKLVPYLGFFVMESDEELKKKCEALIKDMLMTEDYIAMTKVMMKLPVMAENVRKVFRNLVKTGDYLMDEIKELGTVLSNKRKT